MLPSHRRGLAHAVFFIPILKENIQAHKSYPFTLFPSLNPSCRSTPFGPFSLHAHKYIGTFCLFKK